MIDNIKSQIEESIQVKNSFQTELLGKIEEATQKCIECIKSGGKLLICGNGGSAADSQHFAAELVSKYRLERRGLPALALTTNTSSLTAIGNDYGFDRVFARQVEAFGAKGDILFAISTSGNSKNLIAAIEKAREQGIKTIGLTGESGGEMKSNCDILINCPSQDTPRIQECHILVIHIVCDLIEQAFA